MVHPIRSRGLAGLSFVALIGLCALAGCGKQEDRTLPTRPVSGKVTIDGRALAGAEVWLVPADGNEKVKNAKMTIRPYAKTKADGTFVLTSYYADDGAPLGDYAVMVIVEGAQTDPEENRENDAPAEKKAKGKRKPAIPAKYGVPTMSGLSFTVVDGPNQLDLELKSK